jgi:predicted cupin superfamily sugar epimerase
MAESYANPFEYWIRTLNLTKHPEGGYFQESYRCPEKIYLQSGSSSIERNSASSIYFLLPGNEVSCFHRLRYDEIWYYHTGSPLTISMIDESGRLSERKLGLDTAMGESPQVVVPRGYIFGAKVCRADSYTLIGCVVAPGFDYQDFELLSRKTLLEQYPQYREIIIQLTTA